MRRPSIQGVGGVLSADIAVPDHERELGFYSKILTTGDAPLWRDDLLSSVGTPVIGLGARTPEYDMLPLQWMPHFQVANVAASARRVIEMGGEVLMHSQGDEWAVLRDQAGAAFGIIPVVSGEPDSTLTHARVGRISWLSLTVSDAAASRDFYEHVVGWKAKAIDAEQGDEDSVGFEMQIDGETAAAEILPRRMERDGIPPVWLIHLPVDDLAESLRHVREGGGEVIREFAEAKYAVIRDPVGAYFAIQTA